MTDSLCRKQKLADSFIPCVLCYLYLCSRNIPTVRVSVSIGIRHALPCDVHVANINMADCNVSVYIMPNDF